MPNASLKFLPTWIRLLVSCKKTRSAFRHGTPSTFHRRPCATEPRSLFCTAQNPSPILDLTQPPEPDANQQVTIEKRLDMLRFKGSAPVTGGSVAHQIHCCMFDAGCPKLRWRVKYPLISWIICRLRLVPKHYVETTARVQHISLPSLF